MIKQLKKEYNKQGDDRLIQEPQGQIIEAVQLPIATARPRLAMIGNPLSTNEISMIAKKNGFDVDKYKYVKDLKLGFQGDEMGILYVLPMNKGEIRSIHRNIKKENRFKHTPCFLVAPEWLSGRFERELYSEGIRVIFEWPKDKMIFSNLLNGILEFGTNKVKHESEDVALVKAVKNRVFAQLGENLKSLQFTSYNGILILRGHLKSLKLKKDLVSYVKTVPGVRGVLDMSLDVMPTQSSDKDLKKKVRKAIGLIENFDSKTVQFEVKDGRLILTGNVPSKELMTNLLSRVHAIPGVQKVENTLVVSSQAYEKDKILAHRASRIVKKSSLTKARNVKVKVVNGAANLVGSVTHPMEKIHLENVLRSITGIKRVRNHLAITTI